MTPKQIKYFGTARQRAALKNHRRRNASKYRRRTTIRRVRRRRNQGEGITSKVEHYAQSAIHAVERAAEDAIGAVTQRSNRGRRTRRRNVGEILTVVPANPGRRRRTMKVRNRRRRRVAVANRSHRRRNSRVVVRYRNRRHRLSNRRHRRRNPGIGGFLQGDAGAVVGILGGAALTKVVSSFLPASFQSGWTGYIANGLVAFVGGNTVGRVMNNRRLGNYMTIGGLVMVGLQILSDNFPQLSLPFTLSGGTSGMGLISSSNFYVPQVNLPGSMASFVTPAGIPAPVVVPATAMRGIGAPGRTAMNSAMRRSGRFR